MTRSESDQETRLAERHDAPPGDAPERREAPQEQQPRNEEPGSDDESHDEDAADGQERAEQETRKKRRPKVFFVAIIVVILLALGGVYWWLSGLDTEDTDDAYTDGRAVQVAPRVAGRVVSLDVNDNQFVRKGQALIHLDPRSFVIARDQAQGQLDTALAQLQGQKLGVEIAKKNFPAALQVAQANLDAANATLVQRKADFERQKSLPRQATTQQEVDAATSNLQQAQANVLLDQARVVQAQPVQQSIGQSQAQQSNLQGTVETARANLNNANLNLAFTVLRAPQDGWVTRRNVEQGNYVQVGQQIFNIVSPEVWVTANFKETQLNLMRPGQAVKITVDAYPSLDLRGHVDSIQLGSGSKFSAFPAENATGNFVKIVQRVPVKIVIDSGLDPTLPLPLGLSVEPTVTVR